MSKLTSGPWPVRGRLRQPHHQPSLRQEGGVRVLLEPRHHFPRQMTCERLIASTVAASSDISESGLIMYSAFRATLKLWREEGVIRGRRLRRTEAGWVRGR